VNIRMESYFGDNDYWSLTFVSEGDDFTEDDLTAVRHAIESPGTHIRGRQSTKLNRPSGGLNRSYRSTWSRYDGLCRTNRLMVSCTGGQRPGPTAEAYRVLKQRYPGARFTMQNTFLRQQLIEQGLDIVAP